MQLPGTAVLEFVISPVLRAVAKTRADEEHVAILDERRQGEPEFSMRNSLSTASSVNSFAVHTPCNNKKNAFHSLNKETMGPFTPLKLSQMTAGWCIYIWPSPDECKPCSIPLQSRSECGLHSILRHLLSGTQGCGLEV